MIGQDILRKFYKEIVEGGGHINLRNAILKFLIKNAVEAERYLDLGCADGSFTIQIGKVVKAKEIFGVDL